MNHSSITDGDRAMRVLIVSKVLSHVGGVETYISWLSEALQSAGHTVAVFGMDDPAGKPSTSTPTSIYLAPRRAYSGGRIEVATRAAHAIFSFGAQTKLQEAIRHFKPTLIHFHSTGYQLTSSVYRAAGKSGVPHVTTAYEYKTVCSNHRLWNDRAYTVCELCLGETTSTRMRSIIATRCVKGGLGPSVIAAAEVPVANHFQGRYPGMFDAPSRYIAGLLEEVSFLKDRVVYLDLPWEPSARRAQATPSSNAVVSYTGRLSGEKGVATLLSVWHMVLREKPTSLLRIYGDGDAAGSFKDLAKRNQLRFVVFCGRYNSADLDDILAASDVTVHPSDWTENSPFYSAGKPHAWSSCGRKQQGWIARYGVKQNRPRFRSRECDRSCVGPY